MDCTAWCLLQRHEDAWQPALNRGMIQLTKMHHRLRCMQLEATDGQGGMKRWHESAGIPVLSAGCDALFAAGCAAREQKGVQEFLRQLLRGSSTKPGKGRRPLIPSASEEVEPGGRGTALTRDAPSGVQVARCLYISGVPGTGKVCCG